jgi:hypothetical protein
MMASSQPITPPTSPRELAESILREQEERRRAATGPWRWDDDPDWSSLVALAAMVTRWDVDERQFEAKLQRLIRLPAGVAGPAAQRMLALWHAARSDIRS